MNWESIKRNIDTFIGPLYKVLFVIYVLTAFFTFIIGYAGSVGGEYLSDIAQIIPDKYQSVVYSHRYGITFVLIVVFVLYWKRKIKKYENSSKYLDSFQKELGGTISNIIKNYNDVTDQESEKYDNLSRDILDFLNKFTTHVGKIFSSYTGTVCHVSIKTLKDDIVTSWVRETNMSDSFRTTIDENLPSYKYTENTAFSEIIDNNKSIYYVNNWLKVSSFFGKYKNANPSWKKCYSSTLVVPITLKTHPNQINKNNVWGFICVDNKSGGFDMTSVWLLYSFARICFNVFECVPIVNKNPSN